MKENFNSEIINIREENLQYKQDIEKLKTEIQNLLQYQPVN
jgi:hypothetical protein